MKKNITVLISLLLIITFFDINPTPVKAFDDYELDTQSISSNVKIGKKKKIIIVPKLYKKYGDKLLKWSTSNKKLKIVKKRFNYCIVKARKPGKCYVKCKIKDGTDGVFKLKIRITIKNHRVNYKNFKKIQRGMSYAQVKKILGKPVKINVYEEEDHGRIIVEESIMWSNPYTKDYIYIDFVNGYVTTRDYFDV